MPANQSLGVRANTKIETAIREIDVAVGTVVLTRLPATSEVEDGADSRPETVTLVGPETKTFDPPQSGFDVYAPEGARFHLTYETDPVGTEEARDQGPRKRRSSEPRQDEKPKPSRRDRSSSRRSAATKTSGETAKGKASASGPRKSSRGSKSDSSKSGGRKRSSTKSGAKKGS